MKKYILTLLATMLTSVFAVIGCNYIINPFAMYGTPPIQGVNEYKPATFTRVRLMKAYEVRRLRPESVILGSSRVHLAFSTKHNGWAASYNNRYNLAFDGATTKEMYYFILHAYAGGRLKNVILGLDSYHSTHAPASVRPDFDRSVLLGENKFINIFKRIATDLQILISFDTLEQSINTIKSQKEHKPDWFATDGQRLGEIFFHQPVEDFEKYGQRYYFDKVNKNEVGYKLNWRIPANNKPVPPQQSMPVQKDNLTSMDYIRLIVEFCAKHDINLILFITPSHAYQQELNYLTKEDESVENGKKLLMKFLQEGNSDFKLYDFTGYSEITTENALVEGSHEEMKYYWDSSHAKENVGYCVLDKLFNYKSHQCPVASNFGVQLTPDNIDAELAKIRHDHEIYQQTHSDEIKVLKQWVDDYIRKYGIKLD